MNEKIDRKIIKDFFEKELHQLQADRILYEFTVNSEPEMPTTLSEALDYPTLMIDFNRRASYQKGYLKAKIELIEKLVEIFDVDETETN